MDRRKILLVAFIAVVIAQLAVPAKMILDREEVMASGKDFRFRTAPIDPNDPFRGKFIILRYDNNVFEVENEEDWKRGETVYVLLTSDEQGFAQISSVSKNIPTDTRDYITTEVSYVTTNDTNQLYVRFPFDRYYMEESKAYDAEVIHREAQSDSTNVTWALVSVQDGEAVLKDVLINGVSIKEIVKERQMEEEDNSQ